MYCTHLQVHSAYYQSTQVRAGLGQAETGLGMVQLIQPTVPWCSGTVYIVLCVLYQHASTASVLPGCTGWGWTQPGRDRSHNYLLRDFFTFDRFYGSLGASLWGLTVETISAPASPYMAQLTLATWGGSRH